MFSLQNWIALYIHRHIQYRYNEMFHSATSVSIKCLHLVLETDHWSIDITRDCPQLNCWSIICLMILSNCRSPQLYEYVYYIMQLCIVHIYILLLFNWCISPVRSPAINWAPRVDKSCINCTLYSTTVQYYYSITQYSSTA